MSIRDRLVSGDARTGYMRIRSGGYDLIGDKRAAPCQDYIEYVNYVSVVVARNEVPMTFVSWIAGRNG